MTLSDVQRLEATALDAGEAFQMDEDAFRAFYERTARPLWVYLARMTRDAQAADDLLQETYYRLLRTPRTYATEAHRRNYLFRIATNLVRDGLRRPRVDHIQLADEHERSAPHTGATSPIGRRSAPIWRARWPSSSRASASCCGSPTRRDRRTVRSPRRSD